MTCTSTSVPSARSDRATTAPSSRIWVSEVTEYVAVLPSEAFTVTVSLPTELMVPVTCSSPATGPPIGPPMGPPI